MEPQFLLLNGSLMIGMMGAWVVVDVEIGCRCAEGIVGKLRGTDSYSTNEPLICIIAGPKNREQPSRGEGGWCRPAGNVAGVSPAVELG